jgi:hypothetical protein
MQRKRQLVKRGNVTSGNDIAPRVGSQAGGRRRRRRRRTKSQSRPAAAAAPDNNQDREWRTNVLNKGCYSKHRKEKAYVVYIVDRGLLFRRTGFDSDLRLVGKMRQSFPLINLVSVRFFRISVLGKTSEIT